MPDPVTGRATRTATLTAVYGRVDPDHLRAALESLTTQTVAPDEVVVVADGPLPQRLQNVLESFEDRLPLHVVRLPVHAGSGPAKQAELEASTSPLVAHRRCRRHLAPRAP